MEFDPNARPTRMGAAEHDHVQYVVRPSSRVTPEHLLRDEFWEHVAAQLRPNDVVHVYPEDASFYMRLWLISKRVTDTGYVHLRWRVIERVMFDEAPAAPQVNDNLVVKRGKPGHGFRIVNETPGMTPSVVAEGFRDMATANEELERIRAERAVA